MPVERIKDFNSMTVLLKDLKYKFEFDFDHYNKYNKCICLSRIKPNHFSLTRSEVELIKIN